MKTTVKYLIVTGAILLGFVSCQPLTPDINPLDEPGHVEATASKRHLSNMREITNDPARQNYRKP